jgi:menaquinone-dependent protoporphyrinogen IX oxidase
MNILFGGAINYDKYSIHAMCIIKLPVKLKSSLIDFETSRQVNPESFYSHGLKNKTVTISSTKLLIGVSYKLL